MTTNHFIFDNPFIIQSVSQCLINSQCVRSVDLYNTITYVHYLRLSVPAVCHIPIWRELMILLVVLQETRQLVGEPRLQVLLRLRRVHGDEARHLGWAGAAGVRSDAGAGEAGSAAAGAHGAQRHGAVAAQRAGRVAARVAERGARVERRRRGGPVHGGVAVQAQPGDAAEAEDDGVMHSAGPAAVEWQGHARRGRDEGGGGGPDQWWREQVMGMAVKQVARVIGWLPSWIPTIPSCMDPSFLFPVITCCMNLYTTRIVCATTLIVTTHLHG